MFLLSSFTKFSFFYFGQDRWGRTPLDDCKQFEHPKCAEIIERSIKYQETSKENENYLKSATMDELQRSALILGNYHSTQPQNIPKKDSKNDGGFSSPA